MHSGTMGTAFDVDQSDVGQPQDTTFENTEVQGDRSTVYDTQTTTFGRLRAVSSTPECAGRERKAEPDIVNQRYNIKHFREEAIRNVRSMEEAAGASEPLDLGTAGMDLIQTLRELWRLRSLQSDDWGSIVNFVQCALSNEVFETFTAEQCGKLRTIMEDHLISSADADDVCEATDLLESAGWDPRKPMTGLWEEA